MTGGLRRLAAVLVMLAGLALLGCAGVANPPGATTAAAPTASSSPRLSGACGTAISEFETIIDNDRAVGHLNASVHSRITADLGPVKAECAAGRGREATQRLAGIRSRYGYR